MGLQSIIRTNRATRLMLLAGALLMAALVTIPASNVALAQTPPAPASPWSTRARTSSSARETGASSHGPSSTVIWTSSTTA